MAVGTQSATGTASLLLTAPDDEGVYQYRAITAAVAGLPELVSATSTLTVTS